MLTATINMRMESGENIPISQVHCFECDNNFFVAEIHENEPKYCAYCGIKFTSYTPWNGEDKGYGERQYLTGE